MYIASNKTQLSLLLILEIPEGSSCTPGVHKCVAGLFCINHTCQKGLVNLLLNTPLLMPVYSRILSQRLLLVIVVLQEFPDVQAGFHASKTSVKEVGKSFNMDRLSSNQLGVQLDLSIMFN